VRDDVLERWRAPANVAAERLDRERRLLQLAWAEQQRAIAGTVAGLVALRRTPRD